MFNYLKICNSLSLKWHIAFLKICILKIQSSGWPYCGIALEISFLIKWLELEINRRNKWKFVHLLKIWNSSMMSSLKFTLNKKQTVTSMQHHDEIVINFISFRVHPQGRRMNSVTTLTLEPLNNKLFSKMPQSLQYNFDIVKR